jgi:hypothetical protein
MNPDSRHHVADRILHEEIDIVRMIVRPAHGDEQFELGVDLAGIVLRLDRQQRDEEQERQHLKRLEQHHAHRIEGCLPAGEIKLIDHPAISEPRSRIGTTWTSISPTAKANSFAVASSMR